MSKIFFCCCFCLGLLLPLGAQQELGTHFMRELWQSSLSNPAFRTDKKLEIGLPGFYANTITTGLPFGAMVRTESDGRNVIDADRIIAGLGPHNYLYTNLQIETIRLAVQVKQLQLSFQHAIHFNTFLDYPKNLAEFIFQGNGGFVGQTLELGPDIELNAYNEFALGAAGKSGKLGWGLRLKFLTGIGNAFTERRKLDLTTDEDIYQLTLQTDILLNTSSYFRINSLTDFDIEVGLGDFSASDIFTRNAGFAADLGLTFDLTEKWQLAASVLDIGQINWKENVVNYTSNKTINYDGIAIDSLLQDGSIPLSATLDSLQQIVAFTETSEAYKTSLPLRIYLSTSYQYNDRWTFGGLLHTHSFRNQTNWALALSARAKLGELLTVGAAYTIRQQQYNNLGINASVHLGPLAVFAMTDNVLSYIQEQSDHNFNLRAGINLAF